jgi:aminoglycoside phosphotransferase (APT) family kinase protein
VVDWEFAHLGDPVEDLAWCEWIVRMHHPEHVDAPGEERAETTEGWREQP